jgi:hypothetical protein
MEDLCGSRAAKRTRMPKVITPNDVIEKNVVIETVYKPLRLDDLPLEIKMAIVQKSGNLFVIRGASRGWKEPLDEAKLEFEVNMSLAGYVGTQPEQHRRVTQSFEHLNMLGRICTLTSLSLSGCHVARAPGNRFTTAASSQLEHFRLHRVVAEVRLVTDVINLSRNLKVVELNDCRFSDRELGLLGDALPRLANLTTLAVESAGMMEGAGMTRLLECLGNYCPTLQSVNLSGNFFTSGDEIGEALGKLPELTHFFCNNSYLDPVGFERILNGLTRCSQLQCLQVKTKSTVQDVNGIMPQCMKKLSMLKKLERLNLYGFPIGAHALDIDVKLLNRLQTLELSGSDIDSDTLKGILSRLVQSSCLVHLDFERNGNINDDDLNAFVDFAGKVPTLQFIHVNGTNTSIGELRAVDLQMRLLSNAILVFDDVEDTESETVAVADFLNILNELGVFGDSDSDSESEDLDEFYESSDPEPEDSEPEDSDSEQDESD